MYYKHLVSMILKDCYRARLRVTLTRNALTVKIGNK